MKLKCILVALALTVGMGGAFAKQSEPFTIEEVMRECMAAPQASLIDCAELANSISGGDGVTVNFDFHREQAPRIPRKNGCCRGFGADGIGYGCTPPENSPGGNGEAVCLGGMLKANCPNGFYSCTSGDW